VGVVYPRWRVIYIAVRFSADDVNRLNIFSSINFV